MTDRNLGRCALMVTALAVSAPAFAAEADLSPRISVAATGTANLEPDMAVLTLGVVSEAETAREALDANSTAMQKVLDAMKAKGIEERDLQTSNFSIQPKYSYNKLSSGGSDAPKIEGYDVRNALTVRVRDLESLGTIIDESVTLGVNQGGQILFTNDNPDDALADARTDAMHGAIAKARTLTEAAGVELGRILDISEQSHQAQPQPISRMAMAEAVPSTVPVAAGENSYSVTVNVTFEIMQ